VIEPVPIAWRSRSRSTKFAVPCKRCRESAPGSALAGRAYPSCNFATVRGTGYGVSSWGNPDPQSADRDLNFRQVGGRRMHADNRIPTAVSTATIAQASSIARVSAAFSSAERAARTTSGVRAVPPGG
jgi:hypothetical protein